jgi:tetratricopeptide (TPR) repeat protein
LILNAALDSQSFKFARQAALNWLAIYPGDLGISLLLARALIGEGKDAQAVPLLEKLTRLDPEYGEAWEELALTFNPGMTNMPAASAACAYAMGKSVPLTTNLPEWALSLRQAREELDRGRIDEAESHIFKVIGLNLDLPLAAVLHLRITSARKDELTIYRLASLYHSRWPTCLQFSLALAESRLVMEDEASAVSLLHQCVANDSEARVAERLWGKNFRFRSLWPDTLEIMMDEPVPADVAGKLGWNQLNTTFPEKVTQVGDNEIDRTEFISDAKQFIEPDPIRKEALGDEPEPSQDVGDHVPSAFDPVGEVDMSGMAKTKSPLADQDQRSWKPVLGTLGASDTTPAEKNSQAAAMKQPAEDADGKFLQENYILEWLRDLTGQTPTARADFDTNPTQDDTEAGNAVPNLATESPISADPSSESVSSMTQTEDEAIPTAEEGDLEVDEPVEPRPETTQEQAEGTATTTTATTARRTKRRSNDVQDVEQAFEKIAKKLKKTSLVSKDGRFPTYVIMTTKTGLVKQYGTQTAMVVLNEMKSLAETVLHRPGWGSLVFVPDDLEQTRQLGLTAVDSTTDPWKIKLALVDLDQALAKKGAMIGALLIVGGPDIVPFHHLPNPTDDSDQEVLSDNPYSTLDSNYFIPEWPVGRFPGEDGSDAGLLLDQLRRSKAYNDQYRSSDAWWSSILSILRGLKSGQSNAKIKVIRKTTGSFGYTAAVWKKASIATYHPIGEAKSMLVSPPEYSGSFTSKRITDSSVSYYNLHGLAESGDWYGQRDSTDQSSGQDYPVALSPKDLVKNGRAPTIVFSEACYGGNIVKKSMDDAMSLKFLSIGSMALAVSTCIAYGSVTTPLIGADLLGYLFWTNLKSGCMAGEALMKAKVELAKEMNRRQGFLDGEDQKTLISFVFYGDPLVTYTTVNQSKSKGIQRSLNHFSVKTVSDKKTSDSIPAGISKQMLREVKQIVESYLPGLDDAEVVISQEHETSDGENQTATATENGTETKTVTANGRVVVTISKKVRVKEYVHKRYARATLDENGKVIKLAVSR